MVCVCLYKKYEFVMNNKSQKPRSPVEGRGGAGGKGPPTNSRIACNALLNTAAALKPLSVDKVASPNGGP